VGEGEGRESKFEDRYLSFSVVMAARSLIQLYREVHPSMLPRKERVRGGGKVVALPTPSSCRADLKELEMPRRKMGRRKNHPCMVLLRSTMLCLAQRLEERLKWSAEE